jgi:hypothetical protein
MIINDMKNHIEQEPAINLDLQVLAQEDLTSEHPQVDVMMEQDASNEDINMNI